MASKAEFSDLRNLMVEEQLLGRGISDQRVISAMRSIPRHSFVPKREQASAYEDRPLPIGEGQTISQPYMVALMSQMLALQADEKVLEIGTGSGYQSAVLASLAQEIHSIEKVEVLAGQALSSLRELGIENVFISVGDGSLGWPQEAPYNAIIVTAAAPSVPQPLLEQLAPNGRLVLPVGSAHRQILQKWWPEGEGFLHEDFSPVAFVPLIGEHGWKSRQ